MTCDRRERVVVTGATGSVGSAVVAALRERGDAAVALSRDADRARERLGAGVGVHAWRESVGQHPPSDALARADALVESAAPWRAASSTCRGSTSTTSSARCCGASTTRDVLGTL